MIFLIPHEYCVSVVSATRYWLVIVFKHNFAGQKRGGITSEREIMSRGRRLTRINYLFISLVGRVSVRHLNAWWSKVSRNVAEGLSLPLRVKGRMSLMIERQINRPIFDSVYSRCLRIARFFTPIYAQLSQPGS
mgnify:CR=1 FL=1